VVAVSECAHNEVTPPDEHGMVICSRCLEVFKPKPTMGELIERLEGLEPDEPE
jgi:hypothetical protein